MEEDLENLPQKPPPRLMCMPGITFSTEGIKKKVLKIKVNKAVLIPARILCDAASELAAYMNNYE